MEANKVKSLATNVPDFKHRLDLTKLEVYIKIDCLDCQRRAFENVSHCIYSFASALHG